MLTSKMMSLLDKIQRGLSNISSGGLTPAYAGDFDAFAVSCRTSCSGDCEDSCRGSCEESCSGSCYDSCSGACRDGTA
ncbi:MAG: hypothetical protein IJ576_01430 [Synergistaceae bacterium]|nr:hypothetical protein [Synergistaceae bacterium]MBR1603899.1 hypothetical protein [Synergistaceae bacterium]